MIPNDTVQQILAAADIVEVVGEFVSLKKRGSSLIACCPFHNEKSPSFNVSPVKGIYKCFGCGKGGDAVKFVMDIEGLSYPDALRWVAKKYGIEIKEKEFTAEDQLAQNERESLFIALEFAENYFVDKLKNSQEGKSIGASYFMERGFSALELDKFKLGYALAESDRFYKEASKKGFSNDILVKAGLINIREDGSVVDRFRGRVIFPIHNTAGKAIAFGARILKADPKAPKYVNSPETDVYHKSKIVYGISQAKNAIRNADNCFLVEGYTDVVSLHQAGIENVVASSGTSLTQDQIRLIRRFTKNITVLYDGDAAGIKASIRGIDLILEEDMDVKSVVFPDGDDPDSYIRKVGGEEFKNHIKANQKDFIKFKTELSLQEIAGDPLRKAGLITELVDTIVKIPNAVKRSVFYQEVSKLLDIDENVLINEGNKKLRGQSLRPDEVKWINQEASKVEQVLDVYDPSGRVVNYEEALVKILVLYGEHEAGHVEETNEMVSLAEFIFEELDAMVFESAIYQKIFEIYKTKYLQVGKVPVEYLISHSEEDVQGTVINWLSPKQEELSPGWSKYEIYHRETEAIISENPSHWVFKISLEKVQKEIELLQIDLDTDDIENQDIILIDLIKKIDKKKKIADYLGVVLS